MIFLYKWSNQDDNKSQPLEIKGLALKMYPEPGSNRHSIAATGV
jgi:hypothetical protein